MQAVNFDDRKGFAALRKRELHSILRSNDIQYPPGATKDLCVTIAVGAGISPTAKPVIKLSKDEMAVFDLGGKKRTELMAMASKIGIKVDITMKKTEVLALLEKALDE